MKAHVKSDKLDLISELCLGDILKKDTEDFEISKRGIIFVDDKGEEFRETYGDLYRNSLSILSELHNKGVKKGDYIIFQLSAEISFARVFWACILGGIIPVPLPVPIKLSENTEAFKKLLNVCLQLNFPYIITDYENINAFKEVYEKNGIKYLIAEDLIINSTEAYSIIPSRPEDTAYFQYSSGSTGDPKGILLSHKNLIANIKQILNRAEVTTEDFSGSWMPLSHDMGLVGFHLAPVVMGVSQLLMKPETFIKNPLLFLEKIKEHSITLIASPNFGLQLMNTRIKMEELEKLDLSGLKLIFNGAEPISMSVIRNFYDKFEKAGLRRNTIYQVYGMAEACLAISFPNAGKSNESIIIDRKENGIGKNINIVPKEDTDAIEFAVLGYPLEGIEIKIIDEDDNLLDEDQIGNVVIKGPNIFSGYFRKIDNIFCSDGFFRTGDLGFIRDGKLVIVGRKKDVIFVNGQNYYAHDIESFLQAVLFCSADEIAVCSDFNNVKAKDEIIVFLKYEQDTESFIPILEKIQDTLFSRIGVNADFIIPVKSLPKTSSGKPQRFKLIEQYKNNEYKGIIEQLNSCKKIAAASDSDFHEANVHIYSKILSSARKVFCLEDINLKDNFYSIGIDSIKIVQFTGLIQQEFNVKIPIGSIVGVSDLIELGNIIAEKEQSSSECGNECYVYDNNRNICNEPFDLTETQMAYYAGRESSFEISNVSAHVYYEIETDLDIPRLEKAFNKVIIRHPMLRAIVTQDGKQQILKDVDYYRIVTEDLQLLNEKARTERILSERNQMSHFIFDAGRWPLFHICSFKIDENIHYLFLSFDLLILDGSSIKMLMKEIMEFYYEPDLQKKQLQFTFFDYIEAYKCLKNTETYKKDCEYWKGKVPEFPSCPKLPLIKDPKSVKNPHFSRINRSFSNESWVKIKEIAKNNNVTPSALLCGIYAEVLAMWSNQPHMAINVTIFNRYPFHPEVFDILGDFTSMILLDIDLFKEFWDNVRSIQKSIFESIEHRNYSGVDFIRDLIQYRGTSQEAVMPYVFTSMISSQFEKDGIRLWDKEGEIKYTISQTPQVYLDFQAVENCGELLLSWDYVSDIFDKSMIENMFENYVSLLDAIANSNNYSLKIPLTDRNLLERYNKTDSPIKSNLLYKLVDFQSEKTPSAPAVSCGSNKITYGEMKTRSNQIARYLKENGCGRGDFIGVLASRCIDTIVNIVGILKAGCAYVPINPEHPEDRKNYILTNSNCKMLLAPDVYMQKKVDQFDSSPLEIVNEPGDIAYVIYTSGSTGAPKGVIITHEAASNTIIDINQKFSVNENDRIIGLSSMCFDLSVYDIFGALISGAELVIVNDLTDVCELESIVREKEITIWNSVPAIMDMLIDNMGDENPESYYWQYNRDYNINCNINEQLRLVLLSGDWIPIELPDRIKSKFPFADIISLGGATEGSIWSIYYPIGSLDIRSKSIPYGYPLANQKFYVLDYKMRQCPVGVEGELYIGGKGVASGYLNDSEKTKKAFIIHPELGYIYKTGDYGVMHNEGYIEFLGRKDSQIKIRGHRIELGEIQNTLLKISGVRNSVVVDAGDEEGKKYLCAYIVPDGSLELSDIKEILKSKLPDYMIPAVFMEIKEIPLTSNGKINRKGLPEASFNKKIEKAIVKPKNKIERVLVKIWSDILNIDNISTDDNFFDLGGDSLKAATMSAKIRKELNGEVNLKEIFRNPNIKEIAKHINFNDENVFNIIQPIGHKEYYEVSSAVKRMFYLNQLDKRSIAYNNPVAFKIEGEFPLKRLEEALNKIVGKHEILRSSFHVIDNEIVQKVHDHIDFSVDFTKLNEYIDDSEADINNQINAFVRPFDLNEAPLFRVKLIDFKDNEHIFIVDMHHIISDATSEIIFMKDFADAYSGKELLPQKIQYKEFCKWQNNLVKTQYIKKQENFWLNMFKDEIPVLNIPTDFERTEVNTFRGSTISFSIEKDMTGRIDSFVKESGITRNMLFLGVLNIVLSKYSMQNDIVVGTAIQGRNHADLKNIMGMFSNTLAIRSNINPQEESLEYLKRLKAICLEAYENGDYQLEMLTSKLNLKRSSRNPLFDVMFVYRNLDQEIVKIDGINITAYEYEMGIARVDLALELIEKDEDIIGNIQYSTSLFKKETIGDFIKHYIIVLESIVKDKNIIISDISLIDNSDLDIVAADKEFAILKNTDEVFDFD